METRKYFASPIFKWFQNLLFCQPIDRNTKNYCKLHKITKIDMNKGRIISVGYLSREISVKQSYSHDVACKVTKC